MGRHKKGELGEADTEALIQMYKEGMGISNLALLFHVTYNEARRILKDSGVAIRRRGRPSV